MLEVFFSLFGGLAIFIFGMQAISSGLQKIAGNRMQRVLEFLTNVPIVGVALGAVVTAIVQSSSLTTVMVVGFVNAGLMTLKQSIAVIMGANIGTTITGQIIAFKITQYSLPVIAIGFAIYFFAKKKQIKNWGYVVLAFGFLLLGLTIMGNGLKPLADSPSFHHWIIVFQEYRILGLLIGLLITAIIQSSSASIGIIIVLASQQLIPLDAALPILLGMNIGTCVTVVLATIGTKLTAKRAAAAHVIFNIVGSIIFLSILPIFEHIVLMVSPAHDVARQIANAHTIFNIVNTVIFLPLINVFVRFITKILPGEERIIKKGTVYLDWKLTNQAEFAVSLATREVIRMGELALENVDKSIDAFINKDEKLIEEVIEMEDVIDDLEREIVSYLVKVSQAEMTPALSLKHNALLHIANDIERVSDHAENIIQMAQTSIDSSLNFSDMAIGELNTIYKMVNENLSLSLKVLSNLDYELADEIINKEKDIDIYERNLRKSHIGRLSDGKCIPASGVIFLDILSNLERVADHANNIAHAVRGDL